MHFGIGWAVGTIFPLPFVIYCLTAFRRKSRFLGIWIIASFVLAVYATVPNILSALGCPSSFCTSKWMNIFLFHQAIDSVKRGGMLIGETLVAVCFAFQYAILILAVWLTRKT